MCGQSITAWRFSVREGQVEECGSNRWRSGQWLSSELTVQKKVGGPICSLILDIAGTNTETIPEFLRHNVEVWSSVVALTLCLPLL